MTKINPKNIMSGMSLDIEQTNKEKLKAIFPECFSEGILDIDKLLSLCGEFISNDFEKYKFEWKGKSECLRLAQKRSTGTLRPVKNESVNFDNTQNVYIKGDNLEVLKLLQTSYYRKIKMIYIDPPYNTGNDFVYEDDFADPISKYKEATQQTTKSNPETMGRFHTNWLNMMYPRLRLAANLLTDDGVIFISIDDNEITNLRKICDEVFGEENFVAILVWEKKKKGSFLSKSVTSVKEYIVVYCKRMFDFEGLIGEINDGSETYPCINAVNKRELRTIPAGIESKYKEKNYFLPKGYEISDTTMSLLLHSDLVIKDGKLAEELIIEGNWRYSQEAMTEYANKKELYITRDLYLRRIVTDTRYKTLKDLLQRQGNDKEISHKDFVDLKNLNNSGWGSNEDADEELRVLFGVQKLLDYPKPTRLMCKLLASYRNTTDSIILDFFSGSATTAHAVMKLNAEDGGNRRFICVQLPELCDEKSEAYKAGYKTICDIGIDRIKRAGKKILSETENTDSLDIGFKVFELDTSNLKTWDSTLTLDDYAQEEILNRMENILSRVKTDRTSLDMVYEIMLKIGKPLTDTVKAIELDGKTAYTVGENSGLIICLAKDITPEYLEKLCELKPSKLVIGKDDLYTDSAMANALYICQDRNIELKLI